MSAQCVWKRAYGNDDVRSLLSRGFLSGPGFAK